MKNPAKKFPRISPVIKVDGNRLGSGSKVDVQPYTLGDRREVSLPVLEALKQKHEYLFASLGPRLALFLRVDVELKLVEFRATKYYRVAKEISPEFHFNVFRADSTSGSGFMGMSSTPALAAVNLLLGGKGDCSKQSRPLTKIESEIIIELVNEFLNGWRSFTGNLMEFKPQAVAEEAAGVESLIDPHTGVFLAKLKIKIKDSEGDACLVWPVHMIELAIRQLEQTMPGNTGKIEPPTLQWTPVYGSVPIRSEILIRAGDLSVDEFLALQPGSIISLPADTMEQARMSLNGRFLFEGNFGVTADRRALQLKQKL